MRPSETINRRIHAFTTAQYVLEAQMFYGTAHITTLDEKNGLRGEQGTFRGGFDN
jgi:hypothetical protein